MMTRLVVLAIALCAAQVDAKATNIQVETSTKLANANIQRNNGFVAEKEDENVGLQQRPSKTKNGIGMACGYTGEDGGRVWCDDGLICTYQPGSSGDLETDPWFICESATSDRDVVGGGGDSSTQG